MKKEQLEWTPQEMFELLNEGLIEIKDFDMIWVESEITPIDEEIVEVKDVTLGKAGRRFIETDLLEYKADFRLKSVNLKKLVSVNLGRLSSVNLNRLKSVSLNRLKPVSLNKLLPVSLKKLQTIDLGKFESEGTCLTSVNLDKLHPVSINKIFVDLEKPDRINYGANDDSIENSIQNITDATISEDVMISGTMITSENTADEVENSTQVSNTSLKSESDEDAQKRIVVKARVRNVESQDFNDTSAAESKGALVMDLSDDDDELSQDELDREAELIAQRAKRQQEKETVRQEQEIKRVEKSKSNSKKLLLIIGGIMLAITVAVVLLLVWNNEGTGINEKIDAVISESKAEKVEYTVTNEEGKKEKLDFLFVDFDDLITRNNETIAWLKSDDLKLDYPIVQSVDNSFYLSHDIDKKKNAAGWLFMDYENNPNTLDFHTVIYGHNRRDKVVFGNLKSLLEAGVASKKGIDTIYFTTLDDSYIFEICSVFIVEHNDPIAFTTNFTSVEQKQQYIDKLVSANLLAEFARDDLSVDDKFLTLSTCHGASGTSKRLLVNCRLKYKVPNKKRG